MSDDPLAAARRYVQEGQERLRQQAVLVEELLREGQTLAAERSRRLLVEMERIQLERRRWLIAEELHVRQQVTTTSTSPG